MMPGASEARLALELPAPSFVVAHPDLPLLYASSEAPAEAAAVYAIDVSDPEDPRVVGSVLTASDTPSHLLLSRDTLALYVSHYGSGDIAVIRLGADGLFDSDAPAQVLTHTGSGPRADRQQGPRAHFAAYAPDGLTLLVCDLGTDELRRYDVLADGLLRADGVAATLPPGSGPRHLVVRGNQMHVLCELDNKLRTFAWDSATRTAELVVEQPATHAPGPAEEIVHVAHVDHVAGVLLVSVRGTNVISVFDLDGNGLPAYRACFSSGGAWPRHFAVAGERLVVGNQNSHHAAIFDLADVLSLEAPVDDAGQPIPGGVAELAHTTVAITSPACVCPA